MVRDTRPFESSPKMSRTKVSSGGKSPSASQDESGATTADSMLEFPTVGSNALEN